MAVDEKRVALAIRVLIKLLGEDPDRPGLKDTPVRVGRFWKEFLDYDPGTTAAFEETSDDLVAVRGMELWSLCEHHLLPFSVTVSIGYLPRGRVLGLSKFARIAQKHAHRLQLQERLVRGIADEIMEATGSPDVAVVGRGEHTCMAMRGVRVPATMHTSVMEGQFRYVGPLRAEFLSLIGDGR